jgi:hypothetical protein
MEQAAHNRLVAGSSPAGRINDINGLCGVKRIANSKYYKKIGVVPPEFQIGDPLFLHSSVAVCLLFGKPSSCAARVSLLKNPSEPLGIGPIARRRDLPLEEFSH